MLAVRYVSVVEARKEGLARVGWDLGQEGECLEVGAEDGMDERGRRFVLSGLGVTHILRPLRVAQGGRNWESFSAEPYLAGEGSYETILGMQEAGVQACAKHFIGNEQEHARSTV